MKERPILKEFEAIIELVFPNDASGAVNVNELEINQVFSIVLREHNCSLKSGIRPPTRVWVGIVYSGKRSAKYLVRGRRDGALDFDFLFRGYGRLCRHLERIMLAYEVEEGERRVVRL